MTCMKCGKQTEDTQLFCARCLESMENYPVKADAHIQLPVRNGGAAPKKQPRKARTKEPAAQVATLRKQLRWMWVVIVALLLALAVSVGTDLASPTKKTGQNYTYSETTP